ncbi:hypothetical protein QBC39DRAFT_16019 [Podospora conica]|nr:hypothetical protein QBC39DRAFT_16019 [Schizothecium conicum]
MGFATPRPPPTDLWLSHDGRRWRRTEQRAFLGRGSSLARWPLPSAAPARIRVHRAPPTIRPSWAPPVSSVRVMRSPIPPHLVVHRPPSTGPPDPPPLTAANWCASTWSRVPQLRPCPLPNLALDDPETPTSPTPLLTTACQSPLSSTPANETDHAPKARRSTASQHSIASREPERGSSPLHPAARPNPTTFDVRFLRSTLPTCRLSPPTFDLLFRPASDSVLNCHDRDTRPPNRLPLGLPLAHAACSSSKALCRGLGCRRRSRKSPKGPYSERCARTSAM